MSATSRGCDSLYLYMSGLLNFCFICCFFVCLFNNFFSISVLNSVDEDIFDKHEESLFNFNTVNKHNFFLSSCMRNHCSILAQLTSIIFFLSFN